jgi:ABC-type nitrate/sulfonate/bicarbonate transport system permease component
MDDRRTFRLKALSAVMFGALLGILVGVPLDELLGLSTPLYTALQSLVATFTFVGLTSGWPTEMSVQRREM